MGRVVHFEIPADNPERAVKFYTKVFDWKIERWQGPVEYWLVMTGPTDQPGIDGGLMRRNPPFNGTVNTVDVASLAVTIYRNHVQIDQKNRVQLAGDALIAL